MEDIEAVKELVLRLSGDRIAAHEWLFKHRHVDETPGFHREMIELAHSQSVERLSIQAFRGGAKSTVVCEEATIIQALLGEFRNGLIVGEKYERAVERLGSIKHELDTNERIRGLFGEQRGGVWTSDKIELANGVVLQAVGRSQSLRGVKHHNQRPDYCVGDDIEDADSVRTEEARRSTMAWVLSVLIPAMDKRSRVRVIGTPLETDSVMERLAKDEGWTSRKYPIEVDGVATWPARFPVEVVSGIRRTFERMGMLLEYGREYLCEARSGETRQFERGMLRVAAEPRRAHHAVFTFHDPARTVKDSSAHTGKAVWSWIGNRLVVWEASGHFWRPDEIVKDVFETAERWGPVAMGIEPDGLEEFLLQPLRHEAVKRGVTIPLRAIRAPKGKLEFIRGLQPFFQSGEATMAAECPDLVAQMLNFPVGRMDVPNALAYALKMRPGLPVYEDFGEDHILPADNMQRVGGKYVVAVNFQAGILTGVLYQRTVHRTTILSDIVLEGDPQQRVEALLEWVGYETGGDYQMVVHGDHLERYSTSGLVGALRKHRVEVRRGGEVTAGRGWLVSRLQARRAGQAAVMVADSATWTIRALVGGYAFEFPKAGKGLGDRAPEGMYRTLMEGLEAAFALAGAGSDNADESGYNYSTDRHGNRYLSSLPNRG